MYAVVEKARGARVKRILGRLANVLGGVIFLAVALSIARCSGWSFGNLLFGSMHQEGPNVKHAPPPVLPDGQVIAEYKRRAWWLSEYGNLNAALDRAGGKLSASYRTGPRGEAVVRIELIRGPGQAVTLVIDSPPQATKAFDEKSRSWVSEDYRSVWTLRDIDLDGFPDQARDEPGGKPIFQETFTVDGFMRVRDSTQHDAIFTEWMVGLGYCTNRFLHGKDSAFP
jgi:hypothetical protein